MRSCRRTIGAFSAALATSAVAALALAGSALAANTNHLFTATNATTGNQVAVYTREPNGSLSGPTDYATGGIGTGAGLGSQNSVLVASGGKQLLVVNAGSNTVSAFEIEAGGVLRLENAAPSGGTDPTSITQHGNIVYVLNAGSRNISGLRLSSKLGVSPLPESTQPLNAKEEGAEQVQFNRGGTLLAVTEKTSSTIDTFGIGTGGKAGPVKTTEAPGYGPFASVFDNRGDLVVAGVGAGATPVDGVFTYGATSLGGLVQLGEFGNGQKGSCWIVQAYRGRFVYVANAGSGTITGYEINREGALSLLQPSGISATATHPLDLAVDDYGHYLYSLAGGSLVEWSIGPEGGLTQVTTTAPTGTFGLAAG